MARREMRTARARIPNFLFIKSNVFDGDSICQEKIQRALKNKFTLSRLHTCLLQAGISKNDYTDS
jgi:hypothetical protein